MWVGMLFNLFMAIFGILSLGFLLYKFAKIRKGFTPFLAICIIICFEFICGSVQCLIPGTFLLYLLLLFFFVSAIRYSAKDLKDYLKTNSIFFFLCISITFFVIYMASDSFFRTWDEYSHWGPFAKSMKEFGMIHIYNSKLHFVHPSYQQGESLFYFYFSFFYPKYEERMIYASYSVVLIACLAPFWELTEKWKKSQKLIFTLALPLFFRLFSEMNPYVSIYCDVMIAAIASVIAIYILTLEYIEWRDVLSISFSMVTLIQIKDIGLVFAFLCYGLLFIKILLSKLMVLRKKIFALTIPLLFIFFQRFYWKFLLVITQNNEDQFTKISIKEIFIGCINFINGKDEYFDLVIKNVLNAFINRELSWIPFSSAKNFIIIFIFITLLIWKRNDIIYNIQIIFLPIASIGYLILLFLVYRFTMSPSEVEIVNSFERYYGSFLLLWALILFHEIIRKFAFSHFNIGTHNINVSTLLLLLLAVIISFDMIKHDGDILWINKNGRNISGRADLDKMCDNITQEISQSNVNILIFGTDIDIYNMYKYNYMLIPNATQCRLFDNESYWFENNLSDYVLKENIDYVLVINCNKQLLEEYRSLLGKQLDTIYSTDYTGAIYKASGKTLEFLNFISVNIQ